MQRQSDALCLSHRWMHGRGRERENKKKQGRRGQREVDAWTRKRKTYRGRKCGLKSTSEPARIETPVSTAPLFKVITSLTSRSDH
eukprot:1147056-Pelagomonas_calceolata.AAC.4